MFVYESRFVDSKIVVSVVVLLYNTPQQYLRAMIESVLGQTYPNMELCLADGSDTEEVCQICQEYVNKDSRVKYLKLEKNRGISEKTNEAIRLATGEYSVLLDHDDLLVPQELFQLEIFSDCILPRM